MQGSQHPNGGAQADPRAQKIDRKMSDRLPVLWKFTSIIINVIAATVSSKAIIVCSASIIVIILNGGILCR